MKRKTSIYILFITLCLASLAANGNPLAINDTQTIAARAVVVELYRVHNAKMSPFFQTKSRARVDKYFTKTLADLIWKDAVSSEGEVGALDGDPLYNTQDAKIRSFVIGKAVVKGNDATVLVTFTNYGKKDALTFSLKQVGGKWKIDNITYSEGDTLIKWLTETYPEKPAT